MNTNLTDEQIVEGNKIITDFMGVTIKDKSTPGSPWFKGVCWHFYPNSDKNTWTCSSYEKDVVEKQIYSSKHFHDNWNWLMPVYEKISALTLYVHNFPLNTFISGSGVFIAINSINVSGEKFTGRSKIVDTSNLNYLEIETGKHFSLIESVWLGIVDFLKWYNINENKNKILVFRNEGDYPFEVWTDENGNDVDFNKKIHKKSTKEKMGIITKYFSEDEGAYRGNVKYYVTYTFKNGKQYTVRR